MEIDGTQISSEDPYFIAEAGVNHNGDLEMAEDLVRVAADAGADAVKFQTFSADRLVVPDATKADYQTDPDDDETQYEMLQRLELDKADHERLAEFAHEQGITFLSTPFDDESAELLAALGLPAIKIGSGELDNHPLLEHVAGLGRPMVISTGMGTMAEVQAARDTIRSVDSDLDLTFLHCTSAYPCPIKDVNLRAMERMAETLEEPVGYSDHTTLPEMPGFAVAAGACVIEKHFTLDSTLPGPDHAASLEPDELARAVELVSIAARARGRSEKRPVESERTNIDTVRKSLHAARSLESGTVIAAEDVDIIRPADGLSPGRYDDVVGQAVTRDLDAGEPITAEDFDWEFDGGSADVRR